MYLSVFRIFLIFTESVLLQRNCRYFIRHEIYSDICIKSLEIHLCSCSDWFEIYFYRNQWEASWKVSTALLSFSLILEHLRYFFQVFISIICVTFPSNIPLSSFHFFSSVLYFDDYNFNSLELFRKKVSSYDHFEFT